MGGGSVPKGNHITAAGADRYQETGMEGGGGTG